MASFHSTYPVYNPTTHHAQTQLHSIPQNFTRAHFTKEQPPSKHRRADSINPSIHLSSQPTTPITATDSQLYFNKQLPVTTERTLNFSVVQDLSPDQATHVSNNSSQPSAGPQLRKKPKSGAIKNNNLLRAASVVILKSHIQPGVLSTIQPAAEPIQVSTNTYTLTRTTSGTLSNTSPNQKRPPASHSSYGVETICGPPPSYITQRTLSQERIRKVDRVASTRGLNPAYDQDWNTLDDTYESVAPEKERPPSMIHSSSDTTDSQGITTPTNIDNMAGVRIGAEQRVSMDDEGKASSSDEQKNEDLFLNIARIDAAQVSQTKSDKKRSRISLPFLPVSRQSQPKTASLVDYAPELDSVTASRSSASRFHSKHASLGGQASGFQNQPRNQSLHNVRSSQQSVDLTADVERFDPSMYPGGIRRAFLTNLDSIRLAQRSNAGLRSNRLMSETVHPEESKMTEQIATESTVSTTAPSTVWDELDDLKSRIRKLELTGKLPSSSAAAMTSSERPKTATTAATTMSASPKYKTSEANLPSPVEEIPSNIHPLLNEALDNARAVLSYDVYQKLQATARDALQLATIISGENTDGRVYGQVSANERQIRRRTESMCRGLTELAIALAIEARPSSSGNRPLGREHILPPNSMLRGRRYSNEPAERSNAQSRVQSRLDNRRTSLHLARNGGTNTSPERAQYQSPNYVSLPCDGRANRPSTLFRKRMQDSLDGTDEQFDSSPSIRPGSRAMTDLSAYKRHSRDRVLPHQMPHLNPHEQELDFASANASLSVHIGSNFTSRRKYAPPMSAYDSSPITPRDEWARMSSAPPTPQASNVMNETDGQPRLGARRGSFGFSGRNGSSIGSRLREARAEMRNREGVDLSSRHRDTIPDRHDSNMETD